jgi:hypothetical protein
VEKQTLALGCVTSFTTVCADVSDVCARPAFQADFDSLKLACHCSQDKQTNKQKTQTKIHLTPPT